MCFQTREEKILAFGGVHIRLYHVYKDIGEAVLGKNCGAKESQGVFRRLCCGSGEFRGYSQPCMCCRWLDLYASCFLWVGAIKCLVTCKCFWQICPTPEMCILTFKCCTKGLVLRFQPSVHVLLQILPTIFCGGSFHCTAGCIFISVYIFKLETEGDSISLVSAPGLPSQNRIYHVIYRKYYYKYYMTKLYTT